MKKVLTIFGTRPEAIKLAPVIIELKKIHELESIVCVTAQHRQMLDQVLNLFKIVPDVDLDLMKDRQSLPEITSRIICGIDNVLEKYKPDMVMVQGDTTTVMGSSIAAFYRHVPIGHVEAGLRSGNINSPFPEEMNRRVATVVGSLHFAPTQKAVDALLREGVEKERVFLTGNTVVDALKVIAGRKPNHRTRKFLRENRIDTGRKIILVTAHRRENFGARLEKICEALQDIVKRNNDVLIVFPVHLNPNVQETVRGMLSGYDRIILTEPMEYDVLAQVMKASYLVLTDSGGIQEEAPSLGKPVLVMRTETERPEGIEAGTARLVGVSKRKITGETQRLLDDERTYLKMSKAVNPYGDGKASERIVKIIEKWFDSAH